MRARRFQLHPICAALRESGGSVETSAGLVNAQILGTRADPFPDVSARCAAHQAVVAMKVERQSNKYGFPFDLVLTCASLAFVGSAVAPGTEATAASTSSAGTAAIGQVRCPTGALAMGFVARSGTEVDQIGLYCQSFSRN